MFDQISAPERNADTEPFWAGCDEGVLRLPRCAECERFFWPPGPVCPHCQSSEFDWVEADGTGSVYSWVTVHVPLDPSVVDELPYAVGLIELKECVRIVSTIEYPDRIRPGIAVEVSFGKLSDGRGLFTFVPLEATNEL